MLTRPIYTCDNNVSHPYQTQFYLQISVGKMIYDPKKGKGMKVRGEACRKIFIEKDADYNSVLKMIQDEFLKKLIQMVLHSI